MIPPAKPTANRSSADAPQMARKGEGVHVGRLDHDEPGRQVGEHHLEGETILGLRGHEGRFRGHGRILAHQEAGLPPAAGWWVLSRTSIANESTHVTISLLRPGELRRASSSSRRGSQGSAAAAPAFSRAASGDEGLIPGRWADPRTTCGVWRGGPWTCLRRRKHRPSPT